MAEILIKRNQKKNSGWEFVVKIVEGPEITNHQVVLAEDYYHRIDPENKLSPAEIVIKSFEFLLARESMENILKKFNIIEINKYFPEYEKEIKILTQNIK